MARTPSCIANDVGVNIISTICDIALYSSGAIQHRFHASYPRISHIVFIYFCPLPLILHSLFLYSYSLALIFFYLFSPYSVPLFLICRNPGHVPPYMVEASMRLSEIINMERSRIHQANSGVNQINASAYEHVQHNIHPHSNSNLNSSVNRNAPLSRTNSTNANISTSSGSHINGSINGNSFSRVEIPSTAVLERHIHLAAILAARRLYGENAVNMRHHVSQILDQIPNQILNQNQDQNGILESVQDPSINRISSSVHIPQGMEVGPVYHLPVRTRTQQQQQGEIYGSNLLRGNDNISNFHRGINCVPPRSNHITIDTNGHINTTDTINPIYSRVNSNFNAPNTNSADSTTIFCERTYQ